MKYLVFVAAITLGVTTMTSQADAQCGYGGYAGYGYGGGYVVAAPVVPVVYSSYRPVYAGYAYRPHYSYYRSYRPYYGGYYGGQHHRNYGYRGRGRGGVYVGFGY